MTRPRGSEPLPGIEARFQTDCPRCPELILVGDRVVFHRGRPIHVGCAAGSDDQ